MVAILPLVNLAIDLAVRVFGIYNSMPDSDEGVKLRLAKLSDELTDSKLAVAAVIIKDV